MKILFLVNSFKRGGAERVIINLLNHLPKLNSNLNLFLYFLEDAVDPYPVPGHVQVRRISTRHTFYLTKFLNLPIQALQLKKYIQIHKIDIILSFLSRSNYVNILARLLGANHKAIMSERNTPSMIYSNRNISGLINRLLIHRLYPRYKNIIAVSNGVKADLVSRFHVPESNITVIYNPYEIEKIKKDAQQNIDHEWFIDPKLKTIVSVGRLEKQKNYAMLIHAFEEVAKNFKNTRLIIIGEGTERTSLTRLINDLNLSSFVDLIGQKHNPFSYLSQADIFVLSSEAEGFPNVLVEAMICGCPVISTDCKSGPNEIITNGENGILVPVGNITALSNAIITVLQNVQLKNDFKNNSERTVQDYEVTKIVKQYLKILIQET